jgi:hypothetical protein
MFAATYLVRKVQYDERLVVACFRKSADCGKAAFSHIVCSMKVPIDFYPTVDAQTERRHDGRLLFTYSGHGH